MTSLGWKVSLNSYQTAGLDSDGEDEPSDVEDQVVGLESDSEDEADRTDGGGASDEEDELEDVDDGLIDMDDNNEELQMAVLASLGAEAPADDQTARTVAKGTSKGSSKSNVSIASASQQQQEPLAASSFGPPAGYVTHRPSFPPDPTPSTSLAAPRQAPTDRAAPPSTQTPPAPDSEPTATSRTGENATHGAARSVAAARSEEAAPMMVVRPVDEVTAEATLEDVEMTDSFGDATGAVKEVSGQVADSSIRSKSLEQPAFGPPPPPAAARPSPAVPNAASTTSKSEPAPPAPSSASPSSTPKLDQTAADIYESFYQRMSTIADEQGVPAAKDTLSKLLEAINVAEETRGHEADPEKNFEVNLGTEGAFSKLADESRERVWRIAREQGRDVPGAADVKGKGKSTASQVPPVGPTPVQLDKDNNLMVDDDDTSRFIMHKKRLYAVAPGVPASRVYVQQPQAETSLLTELQEMMNSDACLAGLFSPCARASAFDSFMHSVWPFFVAGGTFVLIVPTSELGQGAHTRGLAWKATVEKTTPGRFVIIFVDELGDFQNFHLKALFVVRASDGQLRNATMSGNLTERGLGTKLPSAKTNAPRRKYPRSIESATFTTHERWSDGTGSGNDVLASYDEMVMWLRKEGKLVWAVPALSRRGGDIDMDVIQGREVFKMVQTGLNDLNSEQTFSARQHSNRILGACKASSGAPSAFNNTRQSAASLKSPSNGQDAATPDEDTLSKRRKEVAASVKAEMKNIKSTTVSKATKKLLAERKRTHEAAAEFFQEKFPDLRKATERREAADKLKKSESRKSDEIKCAVTIWVGSVAHLHNFHSDLLRKDNFVASLAADVQKHLRDDYPDSRLTCPKRLCRGKAKPNGEDTISFKNYIGLALHLLAFHHDDQELLDSVDDAVKTRMKQAQAQVNSCMLCSHPTRYTQHRGLAGHIFSKHDDQITPAFLKTLPEQLAWAIENKQRAAAGLPAKSRIRRNKQEIYDDDDDDEE